MQYQEIPFFACELVYTENCPKCESYSFEHHQNKYAVEKWCSNCGYFTYSWLECCNNPSSRKVIYYMKDNRPSIREQCSNCGKLLRGKAIAFNSVNDNDLNYFNDGLLQIRESEIEFLKKDFEQKKIYNFTLRYHKGYIDYLKSEEWKVLREKILTRDNFICQKCKHEKATSVHHLTYKRLGRELLEDLISVCRSCHFSLHIE